MHKQDVIKIWGGVGKLASALGVSTAAISQWPTILTMRQEHEVLGAAVRAGLLDALLKLPGRQEAA